MQSARSFFSLTLYRKHLTRFWPAWAAWGLLWMLILPVSFWSESRYMTPKDILDAAASLSDHYLFESAIFLLVAAPIGARLVYYHLFKAPASTFTLALPLRREGVFFTAFAAGYTMLCAPLALTAVVTWLVELSLRAAHPSVFVWLGGCMLIAFFWFAFATLCAVISGSAVGAAAFYIIFNGVVAAMTWLIQGVLQLFLYGFGGFGRGVWRAVTWCTPIAMLTATGFQSSYTQDSATVWEAIPIYFGVGILMLLAAVLLHHIRKAERAGDLIAFAPLKQVFRVAVTLCGGLAFGMLFMVIISQGNVDSGSTGDCLRLALCCAAAAALSWFVANMLLKKSVKVIKLHWKGALISALAFALVILAVGMDWVGFTTRVPRPESVRSATAEFYGNTDPMAASGLEYRGEDVSALTDLHRYLVQNRNTDGSLYRRINITYDLGLTQMTRNYMVNMHPGGEGDTLCQAAMLAGTPICDDMDLPAPRYGVLTYTAEDGSYGWDYQLTVREAEELWNALQKDVEAGRYRMAPQEAWMRLEFEWTTSYGQYLHRTFYINDEAASTNLVITRMEPWKDPTASWNAEDY